MKIATPTTTRCFAVGVARSLQSVTVGSSTSAVRRAATARPLAGWLPALLSSSSTSKLPVTAGAGNCRNDCRLSVGFGNIGPTERGCFGVGRGYCSSSGSGAPLSYTSSHEYVRGEVKDGAVVDLGITCHAAEEIGELVFVELPAVGKEVGLGDPVVTLESVKSVGEVYCPFPKAEVVELNEELRDNPKLANDDAEGKGWFVRLRVKGEPGDSANKLMSKEKYDEFLKSKEGGD